MKEQFEMKLPKRSETSDFVKEQEKITCPRGHGTRSEAEGSQPLRTALRLLGLLGWKSSLKASLYCRKLARYLYCIITSFMQNFPNQTKNGLFRSGFSSDEVLVSPCKNQNFQWNRPRRANHTS